MSFTYILKKVWYFFFELKVWYFFFSTKVWYFFILFLSKVLHSLFQYDNIDLENKFVFNCEISIRTFYSGSLRPFCVCFLQSSHCLLSKTPPRFLIHEWFHNCCLLNKRFCKPILYSGLGPNMLNVISSGPESALSLYNKWIRSWVHPCMSGFVRNKLYKIVKNWREHPPYSSSSTNFPKFPT